MREVGDDTTHPPFEPQQKEGEGGTRAHAYQFSLSPHPLSSLSYSQFRGLGKNEEEGGSPAPPPPPPLPHTRQERAATATLSSSPASSSSPAHSCMQLTPPPLVMTVAALKTLSFAAGEGKGGSSGQRGLILEENCLARQKKGGIARNARAIAFAPPPPSLPRCRTWRVFFGSVLSDLHLKHAMHSMLVLTNGSGLLGLAAYAKKDSVCNIFAASGFS